MKNRESSKTPDPTLNIWQALTGFSIICSKGREYFIKKNEFLFLVDIKDNFLVFKSENGDMFGLHKSTLNFDHIIKVYSN